MPKMPVTASIAPSTPSTPSEIVATRDANSALSSDFVQVLMVNGKPASSLCSVSCREVTSCCGSPFDRTTSVVELVGDCRIGINIAGRCSSVSVMYRPFSTIPTTWMRAPSALKYLPTASLAEPKTFARKLFIHHRHARRILVVVPGQRSPRQHRCACRLEISWRDAVLHRIGGSIRLLQVGRAVLVNSVDAKSHSPSGCWSTIPTALTPGIAAIASIARRCMICTWSPL